jgi:hypothetical protein
MGLNLPAIFFGCNLAHDCLLTPSIRATSLRGFSYLR